jgi:pyridoxamine 5'-phosphate oxidase
METLERWLDEAAVAGAPTPTAMTLTTVGGDGRPSARVVSLKRLEPDGLVFTTALWTRKATELRANPRVAIVFHWPALGRQARIEGRAQVAERELAEELFAERPRSHQLQAIVSRQGETIEDLGVLRARLDELRAEMAEDPVPCPADWGAVRVRPDIVEFWSEGDDRLHERRLFERDSIGWKVALLAP